MCEIKKSRCVIIGGADIGDYTAIRCQLRSDDFFVYCDSGLKHMHALQATPGLIVGDFDSHENPHLPVETIVLPCEKDDTDTVYAVKTCLQRGYEDFLLIGAAGARLDHTIGNVSVLLYLHSIGKHGKLLDDYSEMEIVSGTPAYIPDHFAFFSLLNITGQAKGIFIQNAKYPLENGEIPCTYQYGISNEVLPGKTAVVYVTNGELLLVKVRHGATG